MPIFACDVNGESAIREKDSRGMSCWSNMTGREHGTAFFNVAVLPSQASFEVLNILDNQMAHSSRTTVSIHVVLGE